MSTDSTGISQELESPPGGEEFRESFQKPRKMSWTSKGRLGVFAVRRGRLVTLRVEISGRGLFPLHLSGFSRTQL